MEIQNTLTYRNSTAGRADKNSSGPSFADIVSQATGFTDQPKAGNQVTGASGVFNSYMDTNQGEVEFDFDNYFANDFKPKEGPVNIADVPLLMPTAENISAISAHASKRFQGLLKEYGIPAPEELSFDREGQMVIPEDYAYADTLKQLFEDHPGMEKELQTVNALTSHFVELQKRIPFIEEMSKASSQSEIDFIIQKYQHLLGNNQNYSDISIQFDASGSLQMMADGNPVNLVA